MMHYKVRRLFVQRSSAPCEKALSQSAFSVLLLRPCSNLKKFLKKRFLARSPWKNPWKNPISKEKSLKVIALVIISCHLLSFINLEKALQSLRWLTRATTFHFEFKFSFQILILTLIDLSKVRNTNFCAAYAPSNSHSEFLKQHS